MKRFRGGLVFKAHRLLYHSTLGLRVIKKKKEAPAGWPAPARRGNPLASSRAEDAQGTPTHSHISSSILVLHCPEVRPLPCSYEGGGSPEREREREREFFIDNLLVRIHFIIVMIRWTGLAPWEFEFPFPGSLTSTFLGRRAAKSRGRQWAHRAAAAPAGSPAPELADLVQVLPIITDY